jgi:arabinofuranosyltransferase
MLTTWLRRYWPLVAATVVLVPHAMMFDFVNDDAYISFRYARNLALTGELVFNPGERVEGFTNFLWTVLLAGGIKLGIGPVLFARFLGVVFGVATLAVVVRMSLRLDAERPSAWHAIAPLGLAALGPFACWCTGGLETQLFTFLTLLGFERMLAEAASGRGFVSGACFALAAMTRPEGVLFFALGGLFRLLRNVLIDRRLRPRLNELGFVAAFALIFVPYFIWRWRYFGWPFPNTFYVKSAAGTGTYLRGLYYLRRFAEDYAVPFLVLVVAAGWPQRFDRRRRDLFALTALVLGTFGAYVVRVGGDFMGLYRFILPVLPLGALCVQEAGRILVRRLERFTPRTVLVLAGAAIAAAFVAGSWRVSRRAVEVSSDRGIDSPGYLKRYVEERIPVGLWLRQHARPEQLASVGGAGVIPYYSEMRSFDCFGLVDQTIAHDPSMTVSDRPGHQKWVADWYLFQRQPDIITHRYCLGSRCTDDAAFWRAYGYEWVTATIPGLKPAPLYSFLKRADRSFGPFPAR